MILMSVIRKLTVLSSNSKQWSFFIAFLLNSLIFWLHLGLWHFPQKLIKCVTSIIRTLWHISRLKINKSYVTFIRDLRVEELHPLCPLSNFSFISTNLKGYMASPWLMLYPKKILLANSADGAPDCLGTNLKSKQTINQKSTFSVLQCEEAFSQFPHAITTLTINISWSYMQWQPLFGGSSSLWP